MRLDTQNFGPWSTSLDAGPRLQLSAFWKRRMTALVMLPSESTPKRSTLAVVIVALVIAATPLIGWAPANAAVDEPAAAADAGEKANDRKFVARFSNGVEVELIGLSKNPSKDQPWWRPDGSSLPERPYADVRAVMGSGLPREICFRWKNLPKDPDYTLSWSTVPAYECAGGGPVDAKGRPVNGLWATAIGLPGSPETCTVQFSTSVSATPWTTVFSDDGRHYSSSGSAVGGKPRGVIWSPARQEGDELLITVSYKAPGESSRLVAVDKGGQEHPASRAYGGGAWDFMQQTFAFDELQLDEVERFEMQTQTREIEAVEFVNVSLEPGQMTKVETRAAHAPEPARPRAAKAAIEFEPVVERIVNDDNPERGRFLIDFETGELHSPPADLKSPKEQFAWIASRGIDATGELSTSVQGLIGFDMIVLPTIADNWDPSPAVFGQVDDGKPGTPATFSGRGELPATFLFKTREGARGVLQILEKNGHDSVKVRYKLKKTGVR